MTDLQQFGGEVPIPNNKASSLFHFIKEQLSPIYTISETTTLAYTLFEWACHINRSSYHAHPEQLVNTSAILQINHAIQALLNQKPIQYITGFTDFFHHRFHVTPDTLIPRPETEELVDFIIKHYKKTSPIILDLGTGSGCIAISLALSIPNAKVWAIDLSEKAIEVAQYNNQTLNASVNFIQADMTQSYWIDKIGKVDCLISNPPYIPIKEKETLALQVRENEPHMALFVKDNDPLFFYRHIVEIGKKILNFEGIVCVETHDLYNEDVFNLFVLYGYANIRLIKDLSGKNRFVYAEKP
ncbi:MAG: peptide chain release factor N(5)-glutamine methyltransferase [Flavobacteriales bacterium]|nr:peptide chain release factor N(5)-glutamine methyltransferase [Flavobacteriales bacterium]